MDTSTIYSLKRKLRIWDSRWTPRKRAIEFRGQEFTFFSTYWWSDVSQALFETEIAPYFAALDQDFQPSMIIDVGAATGHFSIPAARLFPQATVYAFEPSERQRILLARNARINRVDNLKIEPFGLWSCEDQLAFRTNGAESSFESVSRFQGQLEFPEKVSVLSLDQWVQQNSIAKIDLIKIDAEGAEIEILEGAQATLEGAHPRLLVQAYHIRNGARTLERCADILRQLRYTTLEAGKDSGLLSAR